VSEWLSYCSKQIPAVATYRREALSDLVGAKLTMGPKACFTSVTIPARMRNRASFKSYRVSEMRKSGIGVELALTVFFCIVHLGEVATALEPGRSFAQAPGPKAVRPAAPSVGPAQKPQAPPAASESQPAPNPNPPASGGWVSKCVSESRQNPVECSMEQTVVLTSTGQLLASVLVRVPTDTHQPVMMIQVPVGLYLPAGLNLQIDEGKPQPIPLQTCDLKGCYAGMQISQELIASLKAGKRLTMTFQNLAKNNVVVPMALDNFADAYQKIQ
jgi:invasion protein IalB